MVECLPKIHKVLGSISTNSDSNNREQEGLIYGGVCGGKERNGILFLFYCCDEMVCQEPLMVTHPCNLSTWEAGTGASCDQPSLHVVLVQPWLLDLV